MDKEASWCDLEDYSDVPTNIMLIGKGEYGEKLLFLHPYRPTQPHLPIPATPPARGNRTYFNKKGDRNVPQLKQQVKLSAYDSNSMMTEFGVSCNMIADICVKNTECCAMFEMKIDTIRFVGYPLNVGYSRNSLGKGLAHTTQSTVFCICFVLPATADMHIVESFQRLSKKLAIAIETQQSLTGYLGEQEALMRKGFDEWDAKPPETRAPAPWASVLEQSLLAKLLVKVFEDVKRTGAVQVFIDDFVEVGFCVEPKAFLYAHLTPKTRADIDRTVAGIRPYHGVLLLENVYPTPDGNPSVKRFLECCSPDRSLEDLQHLSGIPLLQILLIVQHLLLWARALVIYPLADTNMYTSATRPKPLNKQILRFQDHFGSQVHLGEVLAHFNPPARLDSFVSKKTLLCAQHKPASVVVFLLRHQLIMQLHKFCYIMIPHTGTPLPSPPSSEKRIQDIKADIEGGDMDQDVKSVVVNICLQMLNTESLSTVRSKLNLFLSMAPFLKGENHMEDIMYRLNADRDAVDEVITAFDLVLCYFHRPDHIAE